MQEIDKLESSEALLDQFGERGVENEVVCVGERDSPGLFAVSLVALVEGRQVALDGQFPIDHRKLRAEVGLVEVVGVLHVKTAQTYHAWEVMQLRHTVLFLDRHYLWNTTLRS